MKFLILKEGDLLFYQTTKVMEKDGFDYIIAIMTALGYLVALPLTIISIIKLIKKDEQKQEQINELINQTKELANHNTL